MSDRTKSRDDAQELIERLQIDSCLSFADIGGNAIELALVAIRRWDAVVTLVDLRFDGSFANPQSGWVARYLEKLQDAGADMTRVRVVCRLDDLQPYDVIANLQGFGDVAKVRKLAPILHHALHSDSKMICDIRKGSGSFPYLNDFGSCEIVWRRIEDGQERTRVIFSPKAPPRPLPTSPNSAKSWAEIARNLAGDSGFFRENADHSFLFVPRDKTLVVTFDNLDIAMEKREDRRPWGFSFIEKQGWSMLGVMANGWTWYRDPWVWAEFDRLQDEGFFAEFDKVVFYGASMGGYAACAFSAACPGADVVAISPQSTLDKAVVPWESRYSSAWGQDFGGKYGDAALTSGAARRVSILFDPYQPLDRRHAERFTQGNVTLLRAPLLGHRLGSSLGQMGILSQTILAAIEGNLAPGDFYTWLRVRHTFPRYQRELFQMSLDRGRVGLAHRVGTWVLKQGDHRSIRLAMKELFPENPE